MEEDLTGDQGVLKSITQEGSGDFPKEGDEIRAHYIGTLAADGSEFDSSRKRGQVFKFVLGEGSVIKGWDIGFAKMNADKVSASLETRPSETELETRGLMKKKGSLSNVLVGAAAELEKHMTADRVGQGLERRPSENELIDRGVLKKKGSLSDVLAAKAVELEKHITSDRVEHLLESRPTAHVLESQGILPSETVAPSLQGLQHSLERQIVKDNVGHLLESRPPRDELSGIVSPEPIAPSLQATAKKLSFKLTRDQLHRTLEDRPTREEIIERGLIAVSPSKKPRKNVVNIPSSDKTEEENVSIERSRIATALKGTSRLFELSAIDSDQRGKLKDLVLDNDLRIMAAVEVFELDHDLEEMLDTLLRIISVGN